MLSMQVTAQTESNGSKELGGTNTIRPIDLNPQLQADSLRFQQDISTPAFSTPQNPTVQSYTQLTKQGATGLALWQGAAMGFYGTTSQMPGMMTTEAGGMVLQQDMGRWHFTASGNVNKYWMPWQHMLTTQYGLGGTVAYDLSANVSLHAFGYYYAQQMMVNPAMSPYVNSTTYGGYADIRFSKNFGTNVGMRRYLNPMTGQWETVPIVNPYVKFNNGAKLELPLGDLLKEFIWRHQDHQREFRPHPMSHPR